MGLILNNSLCFDDLLLLRLEDLHLIYEDGKIAHDILPQKSVEPLRVLLGLSDSLDYLHFKHIESLRQLVECVLVFLTSALK